MPHTSRYLQPVLFSTQGDKYYYRDETIRLESCWLPWCVCVWGGGHSKAKKKKTFTKFNETFHTKWTLTHII